MLRMYESFVKRPQAGKQNSTPTISHNNTISSSLKEISYYALSNSVSPCINSSFNFINIVILANKSLPASASISIIDNLIVGSGCSILGPAYTVVSNAYGKQEIDRIHPVAKIRCCLKSGIVFASILSGPAVLCALYSQEILKIIQQPEEVLNSVQEYFMAYSWGIPAIFIVHLEKQIALGVSDIKSVNILTFFDNTTISLLGYLLVNGKFGLAEMGTAGLGYAASITNWLDLIFFSIYLRYSTRFRDYKFDLFSESREVLETLKELCHLGFPIGLQVCTEISIMLGYSTLIGKIGMNALSAYQISMSYLQLVAIPILGLNQCAIFLVGRESGAGRIQNAKKIGTACIALGGGISLLLLGLTSCITNELLKPFVDLEDLENKEIIMNARALFIINGAAQVFDSIRIIAAGSIQGAFKETKTSVVSGIVSFGLIGLPLAYAFGYPASFGVAGICAGRGIGLMLGGCFLLDYWLKQIKNWVLPLPHDEVEFLASSASGGVDANKKDLLNSSINAIEMGLLSSSFNINNNIHERSISSLTRNIEVVSSPPLIFNTSLQNNHQLKATTSIDSTTKIHRKESRCILI